MWLLRAPNAVEELLTAHDAARPSPEIRRRHDHGGDGTFSLVIYRKGKPPEYRLELSEAELNRLAVALNL